MQLNNEINSFLKSSPFFKEIDDDTISEFISNAELISYSEGDVILDKNQHNQFFYILFNGVVSINDNGNELLALNPGRIFGERSLLTDGIIQIQIVSKSNTQIIRVNGDVFFNLIYSNNHILKNLLNILFDRVNETNQQIIQQLRNKELELTQLVEKRTKQLAEKNREITDSIMYAKNLLRNILPDIDEIKQNLDSFIFYQPKDIVAGDFYWYQKIENDIYILVGDCTGHGVPGAITSVICSQKLNEAIEKGHRNLKDILRCVDDSIKKVFRLENHDGMECGLIKINLQLQEIEFCGVGRPMLMVRNREMIELNAVRSSIGHNYMAEEDLYFHKIKLQKGDCFYMFSDGYQDQFGGELNKKYTSKRLKELLVKASVTSISEQEQMVSTEINTWMKRRENQIDDILVLGIKL